MVLNPFREKVVILTGASSGIGVHLSLQLAEQGAWLALAARSVEPLEEAARHCREIGGKALAVPTDVSERSQCQYLVERAIKEYGRVDMLINNAGIGMSARFDKISEIGILEKIMQVNFWGSVYCTHYALPHLKNTRGRLVAVLSGAGKFPAPKASLYAASKHAMAGFFDSLRVELAESGVTVTMIYPSWVATGISTRAVGPDGQPLRKLGRHEKDAMPPEQCARLILRVAAKRERELVMSTQNKLGLWLRLIFPGMVDRIAQRAFK